LLGCNTNAPDVLFGTSKSTITCSQPDVWK
jgi:hypothetical protein